MIEKKQATWAEFVEWLGKRGGRVTGEGESIARTSRLVRSRHDAHVAFEASHGWGDKDFERVVDEWISHLSAQGIAPPGSDRGFIEPPDMGRQVRAALEEVATALEKRAAKIDGDADVANREARIGRDSYAARGPNVGEIELRAQATGLREAAETLRERIRLLPPGADRGFIQPPDLGKPGDVGFIEPPDMGRPDAVARLAARFDAADPKWHRLHEEAQKRYPSEGDVSDSKQFEPGAVWKNGSIEYTLTRTSSAFGDAWAHFDGLPQAFAFSELRPENGWTFVGLADVGGDVPAPEAAPKCDHGVAFDAEAAKGLSAATVRRQWPRLHGACPKGCGFNGIAYASTAHYVAGDW